MERSDHGALIVVYIHRCKHLSVKITVSSLILASGFCERWTSFIFSGNKTTKEYTERVFLQLCSAVSCLNQVRSRKHKPCFAWGKCVPPKKAILMHHPYRRPSDFALRFLIQKLMATSLDKSEANLYALYNKKCTIIAGSNVQKKKSLQLYYY